MKKSTLSNRDAVQYVFFSFLPWEIHFSVFRVLSLHRILPPIVELKGKQRQRGDVRTIVQAGADT